MFSFLKRRAALATAAAAAVLLLLGGGAAASSLLVTGHSGGTTTRTAVVAQTDAAVYNSHAYVNVAGAALTIYAQAGSFITATYTAESACFGTSGAWCSVRILVDGAEAEPAVGTDFAFDSTTGSGGATGWSSHAVTRVRTVATTGFHSVVVQTVQVGTATLRLDDSTLVAQVTTP